MVEQICRRTVKADVGETLRGKVGGTKVMWRARNTTEVGKKRESSYLSHPYQHVVLKGCLQFINTQWSWRCRGLECKIHRPGQVTAPWGQHYVQPCLQPRGQHLPHNSCSLNHVLPHLPICYFLTFFSPKFKNRHQTLMSLSWSTLRSYIELALIQKGW